MCIGLLGGAGGAGGAAKGADPLAALTGALPIKSSMIHPNALYCTRLTFRRATT
jgi:hypothetical protein